MRYQTLWFRDGRAYMPAIGSPPSGMFFEVEPVDALSPETDVIEKALTEGLNRRPVSLPERSRFDSNWPKQSVVQTKAGYKSWKSFAKGALGVAVIEVPTGWVISVGEGASPDNVEKRTLPPDASQRQIAEAIMDIASRRDIWRK